MRNNKEIDKKCLAYLLPSNLRPGRFYLLAKIHKGVLPPPGHPIISAILSPTEKISEFLDFFLQSSLPSIPSHVKDSGHFLYILQNLRPLPENTPLVTYGVASLYTVDSRYLALVGIQNSRARVKWFSRYLARRRRLANSGSQTHIPRRLQLSNSMLSDNRGTYVSRISTHIDIAPATNHNKQH